MKMEKKSYSNVMCHESELRNMIDLKQARTKSASCLLSGYEYKKSMLTDLRIEKNRYKKCVHCEYM